MAPLYTQSLWRNAYEWERLQIALDNTAVELGKSDRALFNFIARQNRQIVQLEGKHHVAHLCRQTAPIPECVALDEALETLINSIEIFTEIQANAWWIKNGGWARIELAHVAANFSLTREDSIPATQRRCPYCGLVTEFQLTTKRLDTRFYGDYRRGINVRLVHEKRKGWNYALKELENTEGGGPD